MLKLARFGHVDSRWLGWGERILEQHGGKTVFLARWTAGLRIFGAWIGGMTHMRWRTFFLWNAAGGITWVTATVLAGYLFGHSLHVIEKIVGVGGVVAVIAAAAVGLGFWRRFEHRKVHQLEDAAPPPEG